MANEAERAVGRQGRGSPRVVRYLASRPLHLSSGVLICTNRCLPLLATKGRNLQHTSDRCVLVLRAAAVPLSVLAPLRPRGAPSPPHHPSHPSQPMLPLLRARARPPSLSSLTPRSALGKRHKSWPIPQYGGKSIWWSDSPFYVRIPPLLTSASRAQLQDERHMSTCAELAWTCILRANSTL